MTFFLIKILVSGVMIAFASWLAGRNPGLAGFLIALPLMTMLALPFAYAEHHDVARVHQFAVSIMVGVPVSLSFFIPFALNKWIKMSFSTAYLLGLVCLGGGYLLHRSIVRVWGA